MTSKPPWSSITRKLRRAILRDDPTYYDMYENAGERYYARLYLHQISEVLRTHSSGGALRILDAGCQTGRLAIPLAHAGHQVTGVDTSGVGLKRAQRHAEQLGAPLTVVRADLGHWLPTQPTAGFDVVVCTEVLYLRTNHQALLAELVRVLKPGGLCFVSHRPAGYYLLEAFRRRDWASVKQVMSSSEGCIIDGSYYNWQDRATLDARYRALGVEPIAITPIGPLSWAGIAPDHLDAEGQELLFRIETTTHPLNNSSGHYLLMSGRKQGA